MKTSRFRPLIFLLFCSAAIKAQLPAALLEANSGGIRSNEIATKFLTPTRVVWISDSTGNFVKNAHKILLPGTGQADLNREQYLTISNDESSRNGILLDFGTEIHGGIEIVAPRGNDNPAGHVRVRFGESVSEAMSDIGEHNSTNDHAIRDFNITVPKLGSVQVGDSGFRFVRIDLEDANKTLFIKEINAVFKYRDIPYLGSFESNDELLNKIWSTGAYTVHLNMQNYLWDGIKRDRLVWVGDMHPEVMTINTVFGYNEVVPKSLDFARDATPLPNFMNGIGSYSIWWILIQRDWFKYQGDLAYLKEQQTYLKELLKLLSEKIGEDGSEILDGERFLDWPTSENTEAIHAGLQALMVMGFEAGAELSLVLNDNETVILCQNALQKLKKHTPSMHGSKQAAALLSMAHLVDAKTANSEVLAQNGVHLMSPFYGYYMLLARAQAGDYQGAMDNIRDYWGAMLDVGANTFWEDFDIDWVKNAANINELVPPGKTDIHARFGNYVYKGFRHSLCHGWASGPTAWLSAYVLGVKVLAPGANKINIEPHLGDLEWVKGTFPTPKGILYIEHRKQTDGSIKSKIKAPKGVKVKLIKH